MKIKNLEFKLGNISFEPIPNRKKIESHDDIMYSYWGFNILTTSGSEIKSTYFKSGDFGSRICEFIEQFDEFVNKDLTEYEPMHFDGITSMYTKVSNLWSISDKDTGDSGFGFQKDIIVYDDIVKIYYTLTFKKFNGEAVILDNLSEEEFIQIGNIFKKWFKDGVDEENNELGGLNE